jgi:hypothetical protein
MNHFSIVSRAAGARDREKAKRTPYLKNGSPTSCCGCHNPFPVRDGHREAQIGQDGRLYCYNMTRGCVVLAVTPAPLRRAS